MNASFVVDLTKLNHADDIRLNTECIMAAKTLKLVVHGIF